MSGEKKQNIPGGINRDIYRALKGRYRNKPYLKFNQKINYVIQEPNLPRPRSEELLVDFCVLDYERTMGYEIYFGNERTEKMRQEGEISDVVTFVYDVDKIMSQDQQRKIEEKAALFFNKITHFIKKELENKIITPEKFKEVIFMCFRLCNDEKD